MKHSDGFREELLKEEKDVRGLMYEISLIKIGQLSLTLSFKHIFVAKK